MAKSLTKNYGGTQDCAVEKIDRLRELEKKKDDWAASLNREQAIAFQIATRVRKPSAKYPMDWAMKVCSKAIDEYGELEAKWKSFMALLAVPEGDISITVMAAPLIKKFLPDAKQTSAVEVTGKDGGVILTSAIPPELDDIAKRIHDD